MSTQEAKKEIIRLLDRLSEESIMTVLTYMRDLVELSQIDSEVAQHVHDILKEDDNLLKRLAE